MNIKVMVRSDLMNIIKTYASSVAEEYQSDIENEAKQVVGGDEKTDDNRKDGE
jgi:hypothetical protein